MPLIGSGGEFKLKLNNCRRWQSRSDLVAALESVQDSLGMIPLEPYLTQRDGQTGRMVIERSRFRAVCEDHYWISSDSTAQAIMLHYQPPFVDRDLDFFPQDEGVDIFFSANNGLLSKNPSLFYLAEIGSRIAPNGLEPIKEYGERLMQFYVLLAQKLIPLLEPDYLWICENNEYVGKPGAKGTSAPNLSVICWANYFGPNYLSMEEKAVVLNAPVGIVKPFGEGIWYQLHEKFEEVDAQVVETIEAQADRYFRVWGTERVQWKFQAG
jgi:hypothetical protein